MSARSKTAIDFAGDHWITVWGSPERIASQIRDADREGTLTIEVQLISDDPQVAEVVVCHQHIRLLRSIR